MSLTITPYVSKSGQTAYVFALSGGALQPITGIASLPTFSVNGNAVQSWGPVWSPTTGRLPCACWQLNCGAVLSVLVQAGGSGYTSPTAVAVGGGGSGCVLGTPVTSGGVITSIPVVSGGSGYTSPPEIVISDSPCSVVPVSISQRLRKQRWRAGQSSGGVGSGASAAPVMSGALSTDTVTFSAPANWISTAGGTAPAASGAAVANYVGQLEPGIGGYLGFGLPAYPTLEVGFGVSGPISNSGFTYNIGQNWLKRGNHPWTGAVTSTLDGLPLTVSGAASTPISNCNTLNHVDGNYYPDQTGTWTLIADDLAPGLSLSLMTPTWSSNSNAVVTPLGTAGLVSAGTLTGGVQIGRVWQWQVARSGSAISWNFSLGLQVTTPGSSGTYPFTLRNMSLFSPATTAAAAPGYPVRNDLLPDQALVNWLTTPHSAAASLRFVDSTAGYGGLSNTVDPTDILDPRAFCWDTWPQQTIAPTGDHLVTITTMRTYTPSATATWPAGWANGPVTWSSPNVLLAEWNNPTGCPIAEIQICNGGGSASSTSYATYTNYTAPVVTLSGGGGSGCVLGTPVVTSGAIMSIPVISGGSGYTSPPTVVITDSTGTGAFAAPRGLFSPADPSYLNWGGPGAAWVVGEAVTSAPHNLAAGQIVNITSGSTPFLVSNGPSAVVSISFDFYQRGLYGVQVWPTGPSTFAWTTTPGGITPGSGAVMPGGINNVAGSFAVSYTVEVPIPDSAVTPFETTATVSGSLPGCDHFVNVPTYATDAAAASIAQRIRDNFPKGRRVYVEYSNENWNFVVSQIYTDVMGALGAWGALAAQGAPNPYIVRASQHHDTFVSVFNQTDIHGNTNRGGEIVRLFGGWDTQPPRTASIVNLANTWNTPLAGGTQCNANMTVLGNGTPSIVDQSDSTSYELGMRFQSSVAGFVTGVRFYKCANNTGTHVGNLWSASGTNLATVTFANETATGWQQMNFPSPVLIAANTTYTISYYDPNHGHYSKDAGYFASPVTSADLTALASSNGGNGVYHAGSSGFPTNNGAASYWVDVMFSPGAGPTVIAFGPVDGATFISVSAPVITAQFDEPVQPGTISFVLTGPSGTVPSTTTYNLLTRTATLTPTSALAGFTTYTVTMSGAEDLANNAMVAPASWSFQTLSAVPIQVDAVCIAPYTDLQSNAWPDPSVAATVNPTSGGSTGGLLVPGTYYAAYTWIDSLTGKETGPGSSGSAQFTVASGNIPQITIPAVPAWASSANIYLTLPNGAMSSEVRYLTGVTALVSNLAVANAGTVPLPLVSQLPSMRLGVASLASGKPTSIVPGWPTPWTRAAVWDAYRHTTKYDMYVTAIYAEHQAALAAYVPVGAQPGGFVPALVGYEGGVEAVIGGGLETGSYNGYYLTDQISHDLYYDPECRNGALAVFQKCQQGGMSAIHIFNLCDPPSDGGGYSADELWGNVTWAGQPAGRGDGSLTTTGPPIAVTNKFWVDTGTCHHLDNTAVLLQGARDWIDAANPVSYSPLSSPIVEAAGGTSAYRRRRANAGQVRQWPAGGGPVTHSPLTSPIIVARVGALLQRLRYGRAGVVTGSRPIPAQAATTEPSRRWFPGLRRVLN